MGDNLFVLFEDSEDSDDELLEIINIMNPRDYRVRDRPDHMAFWTEREFIVRFRISKNSSRLLTHHVKDLIRYTTNRNSALTPLQQVLVTLRFFASGNFQVTTGDFSGVHQTTVSKVVKRVCQAICTLREIFIFLPNEEEKLEVHQGFFERASFPRALLCLDGTHVRIESPGGAAPEQFRNRKGYFSINVQIACDHYLRIRNIVARWPGSSADNLIFLNSHLKFRFDQGMGNSLIVADSGYGASRYVMTPIQDPQTRAKNLYNESHIRTRNAVERTIGIWKRRFPVLSLGLRVSLINIQRIIVATAIIQNIARNQNDPEFEVDDEIQQIMDEAIPNDLVLVNNFAVRNELVENYFANL